ncbi:MAG: NfeD family protein [Candidatus Eisenbacteria bacterium]
MGEITGVLDLIGALFRLFGLDQSAWFPALALIVLFFLIAVPVGLLAQSRTVSTGKDGMIGEVGVVLTELDPDGRVYVHSEYWNARSARPLPAGAKVVVVSVDRMVLEVEQAE